MWRTYTAVDCKANARRFEGALYSREGGGNWVGSTGFEPVNGRNTHARGIRQFRSIPAERYAGHLALCRIYHLIALHAFRG